MLLLERADTLGGGIVLPLSIIVPQLSPIERRFIDKLDKELGKVEKFYLARERDAKLRYVSQLVVSKRNS